MITKSRARVGRRVAALASAASVAAVTVALSVAPTPAGAAAQPDKPANPAPVQIAGPVPDGFPSWQALMAEQNRLDGVATRITERVEATQDPGYGAIAVSLAQREVHLYWKGNLPASMTKLLAELHATAPVRVLPARHSAKELETEVLRIIRQPATAAVRVTSVGPRPDASGVQVSVEGSADAARELPAVRAARVPVAIQPGVAPDPNTDRWNDTPLYWGGAAWQSTNGGGCSTGFALNQGGTTKMLTAGHCAPNGEYAWTGTSSPAELNQLGMDNPNQHLMGTVEQKNAGHDTELINTGSQNITYFGDSLVLGTAPRAAVTGWQHNYVGDYVFTNGARSGTVATSIKVVAVNEAIKFVDDPDSHYPMHRAEEQSRHNAAGKGDSGGPVLTLNGTGGFLARGIISAGDNTANPTACTGITAGSRKCSWRIWYAPIGVALASYNATLAG